MPSSMDDIDAKVPIGSYDGADDIKVLPSSVPKRPPIEYSSFSAFSRSFGARFRSIFTRRFVLSLLAGQVVSLCITCTNVTTSELVSRNWALPTTQSFFL